MILTFSHTVFYKHREIMSDFWNARLTHSTKRIKSSFQEPCLSCIFCNFPDFETQKLTHWYAFYHDLAHNNYTKGWWSPFVPKIHVYKWLLHNESLEQIIILHKIILPSNFHITKHIVAFSRLAMHLETVFVIYKVVKVITWLYFFLV